MGKCLPPWKTLDHARALSCLCPIVGIKKQTNEQTNNNNKNPIDSETSENNNALNA
jgi:hypothetical protein